MRPMSHLVQIEAIASDEIWHICERRLMGCPNLRVVLSTDFLIQRSRCRSRPCPVRRLVDGDRRIVRIGNVYGPCARNVLTVLQQIRKLARLLVRHIMRHPCWIRPKLGASSGSRHRICRLANFEDIEFRSRTVVGFGFAAVERYSGIAFDRWNGVKSGTTSASCSRPQEDFTPASERWLVLRRVFA